MITSPTPILGFAGFSGSGKTTLLEQLIPLLSQHKLRIGLLKHSHHDIDPDTPGKDSYRLRHAGCSQTLLATKSRHMLYFEYPQAERQDPELNHCLSQLNHDLLDLVLIEGFREQPFPKIEIHRPSYGKPLLYPNDDTIVAFASDQPAPEHCALPQLDLNNPHNICQFIINWLRQS
ncbi:molybdopterin-guanine dinucleotide biosynthesis protein B [Photobacterium phosphoreum]|uniref:molybdopterin-guanine dinucleotide biosynthesis protein B n=1 Tax=Photobacterium phosphoreum TaxID=659 RepID=UPI000D157AC6|nr:molybdopterin-guanine dinucleotide biosynthesis protein B [Photobacterium phosphoreum]MCD9506197.1 molybdopterin-guanine dinucleotide biosynthesis protein B [Photobacterium phosphoreum]PSW28350.1 molybdopterin-guanine dinucleotide biosynthesis protein B [Photobacterium phosphoreum]